jgi:hypothetical protein
MNDDISDSNRAHGGNDAQQLEVRFMLESCSQDVNVASTLQLYEAHFFLS